MIIENKEELSITKLRKQALDIIETGINRVLPSNLMKLALEYDSAHKALMVNGKTYNFSEGRLFVIGGGKAAGLMAETLEEMIGPENISAGVVICKKSDYQTEKIKVIKTSHPIPDEKGIEGVKEMLALKDNYSINENDLVICLISGGGSALMPCPVYEITLEDKQKITNLLLGCGASIHEINAVRKHLSKIKGGRLGLFYSPTKIVSLMLSDVVGNDLDVIASGPTYPDSSTFSDAFDVLKKYDLLSKAPESVIAFLEKGCQGKTEETPKTLDNCDNYIIGDNRMALEAMRIKSEEMGFKPYIITSEQTGDPVVAAELRAKEILEGKYEDYDVILIGGETTPKLPENAGKGGRNQHYAVASILAMEKYLNKWVMANAATDGMDFLPGIAGAIIDNNSLNWIKDKKVNVQLYLDNYDSNTLLEEIGKSLIETGHTDTNVGDVTIYILDSVISE